MVLSFTGVEKTALWVGKDVSGGAGDVFICSCRTCQNTKGHRAWKYGEILTTLLTDG